MWCGIVISVENYKKNIKKKTIVQIEVNVLLKKNTSFISMVSENKVQ